MVDLCREGGEGVLAGDVQASARGDQLRSAEREGALWAPTSERRRRRGYPHLPPTQRSPEISSLRENGPVAGNDGRVVPPARLDRTLLRLVVDMNDAEPLGVAERPLVVVEQRPGKISAQVDAFLHRVVRSAQVLTVILDAKRILDLAVDGLRRIVKRGAVLGDVDGRIAVPLLHPEENPGERGGKDF